MTSRPSKSQLEHLNWKGVNANILTRYIALAVDRKFVSHISFLSHELIHIDCTIFSLQLNIQIGNVSKHIYMNKQITIIVGFNINVL